ncbi:MAG: LytTR family DNA-binding domain-containing protein [Saprospiraceae bacterium]
MKLKAIIVDDEKPGRENLKAILHTYLEDIEVIGMAGSIADAQDLLANLQPDVMFLDIELGNENGLDFLKGIENPRFETIFVTAYEEYAVRAFRTSAIDYLVKPIDIDSLKEAIEKVTIKLKSKIDFDSQVQKIDDFIKISTQDGKELISMDEILYLQSINYYTKLVLVDGREIISTRTLKDYQLQLANSNFFRIHNSYIIHIKYLKGVVSKENFYAKLTNNILLSISRRRKDEFFNFLKSKPSIRTEF